MAKNSIWLNSTALIDVLLLSEDRIEEKKYGIKKIQDGHRKD